MRNVLERVPADETDEWQGIDWREARNLIFGVGFSNFGSKYILSCLGDSGQSVGS